MHVQPYIRYWCIAESLSVVVVVCLPVCVGARPVTWKARQAAILSHAVRQSASQPEAAAYIRTLDFSIRLKSINSNVGGR